jgi:hypothetical protein
MAHLWCIRSAFSYFQATEHKTQNEKEEGFQVHRSPTRKPVRLDCPTVLSIPCPKSDFFSLPPREVTIQRCHFRCHFATHNIYRPSPIRTVMYSIPPYSTVQLCHCGFYTTVQVSCCLLSLNFKHVTTTSISRVL